ncbi:MAG: hypothetical protein IPP71_18335 [Bacteroidetes bacterium]|nr:hypothetical protein [Bacteroidota bacterium]
MVDSLGKLIAAPSLSWMTNGNFLGGNEFIGSTNSKDLVFKTSGLTRMKLKSNGKISISEFETTANGILYTDYLGEIWKLDFDPSQPALFLDASGNFTALPTGSNAWSLSGQTVYNLHSGNTGIGIANPAYKFHVVHDPGTSSSGGVIVESNNANNANSEIKFKHAGNDQWSIGSNVQHNTQ